MDTARLNESGFTLDAIFLAFDDKPLLRGVHVNVLPGQICALFGRNGCGKSSLLKIGAGLLQGNSGITIIDGNRLNAPTLNRRYSGIAYLPQDSMLPTSMTVRTLVSSSPGPARLQGDPRIVKVMSHPIGALSTGMRRYLEIQFILSLNRSYYLLDEPFTGIEPILIESLSEAIRESAAAGSGFLIADHYHHYLVPIATDAYIMTEGRCQRVDSAGPLSAALQRAGYLR